MNFYIINMHGKLPSSLTIVPIVETIFDIRFESNFPEEVLAGMLYAHYKDQATAPFEKLPSLQIPEKIRTSDPNLQYVPLYRITRNNILIQIGSRSISLINSDPYLGWNGFLEQIQDFIATLVQINFIIKINRIGLRYINFIEKDAVEVCNVSLNNTVAYERKQINITEVYKEKNYLIKIAIANGANLSNPDKGVKQGSAIDIDVFMEGLADVLDARIIDHVCEMHSIEKTVFVASLKTEFLNTLGPIYE